MAAKRSPTTRSDFPPGVAAPARRALASLGVTRLDQLDRFRVAELRPLHGMGPRALEAIRVALRAQGKSLAGEGPPGSP